MRVETRTKLIELSNQLDDAGWELSKAIRNLEELEYILEENESNCIKDIDNFKRELKRDGLYSEKIEDFIENYMKYYNK